jgi:hypothetical protein
MVHKARRSRSHDEADSNPLAQTIQLQSSNKTVPFTELSYNMLA